MINKVVIAAAGQGTRMLELSKDKSKVIDFGVNLVQLRKKLGDQKVIFMKVPSADAYLSF